MVNATLEIAEKKIQFSGLEELRSELRKQAGNKEYLAQFETTINEALRESDKDGIIEFTEDEWQQLITHEGLPPIEEVKELLASKINAMKEVTAETKEKTGGLAEEFTAKVDEVKKWVTGKIDEVKEKGQAAITEVLSPFQKIKEGFWKLWSTLTDMWSNIWTPVKFAWYTLWATLGFKFGKEALATMTKEKAEKVIEAGKEKAKEEVAEAKEWLMEKTAPLAILAGAGVGILATIKSKLPASLREKIGDAQGSELLKKLATSRALRLFGISGLTLFGIGKLWDTLQDPKIAAELGEIPNTEEGKKEWWKKAIEKAGIGIKDGAEEIWAIVNWEKLDDYLTSREDKEEMDKRWYVTLDEHPSVIWAKKELGIFEKQCEVFFNENKQAFNGAVAAGLILKPGMVLGAGIKWAGVALSILKFALPGTIIPAGITLALLGNAFEGIKHIQVPKDLGPEDIKDILEIPDIKAFLESQLPGITEQIHFDTIAKEFQTLEQKIKEFNTKAFWTNLAKWAADKIIESPQEKINSANELGMKTLVSSLELIERKESTNGAYVALLWDKENPWILKEIISKISAGNTLTEWDIRALMEATEWTNIRIFPRDNTKSGTTIQWQTVNEHWTIKWAPRNICVNPTLEYSAQFEIARDFVVDEYNLNAMNVVGKAAGGWWEIASELAESIKNNHEKSGSLIETIIRDGWSVLTIGLETFAVDYLGNKYFLGPWNVVQWAFMGIDTPEDKIEMQEGLVEYGQGLAPVMLFTILKRWWQGKRMLWLWTILESVSYPLRIPGEIAMTGVKWSIIGGKYIFNRALAGDFRSIFTDPKNQFTAYFRENIHKFQSLQKHIPIDTLRIIGGQHKNISQLEKARKWLYEAKQSSWWRDKKIKDAFDILEKESSQFELKIASKSTDNASIKKVLAELENEIEGKRILLQDLEKGIRQHFPQELGYENRTAEIESLKKWPDMNTPEGKKLAYEAYEESKKEIEAMEEKRIQTEKELTQAKKAHEKAPWDAALKQDFENKKNAHAGMMSSYHDNHRWLSEIREAMGELLNGKKPKIRIWESHIRSVKWLRGSAKILGIIAVTVWAWVAIEKVANAIHGDSSEIDRWSEVSTNDDQYYGFKKDARETNIEKKEGNEYTCETPEEFNERIEAIETQYTESINKFFDPEFVNSVSSDEREKHIQEAADGHMLRVDIMKSLIRENKTMMEAFWNKTFTNEETGEEIVPNDIREQGVKAFMFIHKKDGELTLDYMNHQDMKNVFYILYDGAHTSFLEQGLGEKWAMATDLGLRVAPFTGSFMDGKDAYQHFSRGNTMDGVWSTAWCIGGLALDIGWFFSFGWTAAAGTALRTTKAGVKIAKTAWGALLHNGVQLGVQFGTSLAKVPRSESISINNL